VTRQLALLLVTTLALFGASAEAAQSPEEVKRAELKRLEQDLTDSRKQQQELDQAATALHGEIEGLRQQLVLAGQTAREKEEGLSGLEAKLAGLEREEAAKRDALDQRRQQIAALVSALQRLAMHPPEAMLALPQPPADTVRGAILMASTLPSLGQQAEALRKQLDELKRLEASIQHQRAQVETASGTLAGQRREIEALLAQKAQLEQKNEVEGRMLSLKVAQMAASAGTLHDLIDKLTAEREQAQQAAAVAGPSAIRPPSGGSGVGEAVVTMNAPRTLPAAGKILLAYGQDNEFGVTARGLTIETRSEATIVSPSAGRVLFAGPFRGYGQILIIEHAEGYHSLIAGIGRIDSTVGAQVAAGEPIGAMAPSNGRNPTLYFELRRFGQPLNPQPWLTMQRTR
jgi:septal ring factor EnvC (AmiA/AmiB activator)